MTEPTPANDPGSPAVAPIGPMALDLRGRDVLFVFLGLFGGGVLLLVFAGIMFYVFVIGPTGNVSNFSKDVFAPSIAFNAGALVIQAALMTAPVYFFVLRRRRLPVSAIGFRPFHRRWFTIVPVLALLLAVGGERIERLLGKPLDAPILQALAPEGFTWTGMVVMLVVAGAIVPLAEEIFFRGVLYTWLRNRWGPAIGVIASSLIFGLFHMNLYWIAFAAVLGVVLALLYELSNSIWPAVGLHAVYNSIGVIWLYATIG